MKKEEIYIDLRNKSKEELTELYNFLKSIGEELYADNLTWFLEYSNKKNNVFHYNKGLWSNPLRVYVTNKQEITIQQLKEILQPMETSEPKSNELKALLEIYYSCRDKYVLLNKDEIFKKYDCLNSEYMSVCLKNFNLINLKGRRSKWITSKPDENMADNFSIFVKDYVKTKNEKQYLNRINKPMDTLEQQLEKAKAEVDRIQKAIEEENKPKNGDFCIMDNGDYKFITIFKKNEDKLKGLNIKKITDQDLIKKLNELIK